MKRFLLSHLLSILVLCLPPVSSFAQDADFGDAPEGVLAYPTLGIGGQFPTCIGVGPNGWIQHFNFGIFFGPASDAEQDGNGGACPIFNPDTYNQDECFNDGDAGLLAPGAFTIAGPVGSEVVQPCVDGNDAPLGNTCTIAAWGVNIDIMVTNPIAEMAFVNVLMDWDRSGNWSGGSTCPPSNPAPEHVLVNFPVPIGFNGPLSVLAPPGFLIGPNQGYVWARFTISDIPVGTPWEGFGEFAFGETEDYLLLISGEPSGDLDFGDAPEGALAYPVSGVVGSFPTCMNVPLSGWIQHTNFGAFFGPLVDFEAEGNQGLCPLFNPNAYNQDECFGDGDAGLIIPGAFTITGLVGAEVVMPCVASNTTPLGNICTIAVWGANIDILVTNNMPNETIGYVNVLIDWDQNGSWPGGSSVCPDGSPTPEHVLVDFPVPNPYTGPLSLLAPPPFLIGPNPGFVWARFSITEVPVGADWEGSGAFEDGESEDYLLLVEQEPMEDMDFGDAPDLPYETLLASDGARHTLDGITYMGVQVDAEPDGQPTGLADGDDLNPPDDEDGVTFTSPLIRGQNATVNVVASVGCLLNAWIDFNGANSWLEAGEHVFVDQPLVAGVNALLFPVPPNAFLGLVGARFRVNQNGGIPYTGYGYEGEVEDYMVLIEGEPGGELDFGDAPEYSLAYPNTGVPGQFPTCITVGTAGWIQHTNFGAFFGPSVDLEADGNAGWCPLFNPNTYDQDECFNDGDAGLLFPISFTIVGPVGAEIVAPCPGAGFAPLGNTCTLAGWGGNIDIVVNNFTPFDALVNVLIDWDQNGVWSGSSMCPPGNPALEHVLVNFPLPAGFSGPLSVLLPPPFLIGPNPGYVWARFSITEQPVPTGWEGSGAFEDGETEDYLLLIVQEYPDLNDFGDAPDGPYPTLANSNGANHMIDGVTFMGGLIDGEADGQPTANADGDDLNYLDDADGVAFTSAQIQGQQATINVVVTVACTLNAWIDFNQINGWADAGEQIFTDLPLVAGLNPLTFQVPANAIPGATFMRFRVNANGGLSYTGFASEGEVEDYKVTIIGEGPSEMDFGDAPEGALAYPASGVQGMFPTCMTIGPPSSWIQHMNFGAWFGPSVDFEPDGNAGQCPLFNNYNQDECFIDGDAGLILPGAYTIVGPPWNIIPCPGSVPAPFTNPCMMTLWGPNLDIQVQNFMPGGSIGYINVLIDWDQNGVWGGSSTCPPSNPAPEHVLVNFVVPNGFSGPLSALQPPPFLSGPNAGYVWVRFSITEQPVVLPWDGSGMFEDGETEDYLMFVASDLDYGDAPDGPYPTLLANNGARHTMDGITFIGTQPDPEADGQPTANADGDDLTLNDDEDGVTFTSALIPGQLATLNVVASVACMLNAWMDFNQLNGWTDPGEQIFINQPLVAGVNPLAFPVPAGAALGNTFARFRVNQNGNIGFIGHSSEGEVEDNVVFIEEGPSGDLDFGDAPEDALAYPGIAAFGWFPTCIGSGTAGWIQHMNFGAFFGPMVDFELDGNAGFCPLFNPDTYNQDECFGDGDAGLIVPGAFTINGPLGSEAVVPCTGSSTAPLGLTCTMAQWGPNIDILVTNNMPSQSPGYVNVLIDWNRNGMWAGSSPCPGQNPAPEHVLVNFVVPNPYNGPLSALLPPPFLIGPFAGYVWARITITEIPVPPEWDGSGSFEDGETEDYLLLVVEEPTEDLDFGDAPDGPYPTLLVNDGARHTLDGFTYLGPLIDPEPDGQASANADGDDILNADDEDGVIFTSLLTPGQNATVDVYLGPGTGTSLLFEDWSSGNFTANSWTFDPDQGNWLIDLSFGNPAPDSYFDWFPQVTNYSYSLVSKNMSGLGRPNVILQYDVALDNWSSITLEELEVEVWNGTIWTNVANYNNAAGDIPWTTVVHDISAMAIGHDFKVRFRAHGQDSYNIDAWDLDNIKVFSQVAGAALLNAWVDFNQANGWTDPGEQIFIDVPLVPGLNNLMFPVPATAVLGPTYARFRVNQNGGLNYFGYGYEGEVEDYKVFIEEEPTGDLDFGDAPEDALAYPGISVFGWFPTCIGSGTAGWIQHTNFGAFFGPLVDLELDGNAGFCPLFNPNTYNQDECFGDGDAGLIAPGAFTITGPLGGENVVPCPGSSTTPLGYACTPAVWGPSIDILVTNNMPGQAIGYVNVLIDWDQNGSWGGSSGCPGQNPAPEHVLVNLPVPNGFSGPLSALLPPPFLIGPNPGFVWARISITEVAVQTDWSGSGGFEDGETEDYLLLIEEQPVEGYDFGDAPEGALAYPTTGTVGQFPTCITVGPASWIQHSDMGVFFGPAIDLELDGNSGFCPLFNPNSYNMDECFNDGDAGLVVPGAFTITGPIGSEGVVPCPGSSSAPLGNTCTMAFWGNNIDIQVQNGLPDEAIAYVNVLIDWNKNGNWSGASPCPLNPAPEHVLVNFPVPNGFNGLLSVLQPPPFRIGPLTGYVWARFTVTDAPAPEPWDGSGSAEAGETEDYLFLVEEEAIEDLDFGDAPDGPYPTLLINYGAFHTIDGIIYLGAQVDPEADGQPTANADGDDLNNLDDEDGVNFVSSLVQGQLATVNVTVSIACMLNAWIDFNQVNGWIDAGEQVFTNHPLAAGLNTIAFTVPTNATPGITFARFRVNHNGSISYDEYGYEGEVEDYQVMIEEPPVEFDFGDVPDGNYPTLLANNGARHWLDGFTYLGALIDSEADGQPSINASGDDNSFVDDEDGVTFTSQLVPGQNATVDIWLGPAGAGSDLFFEDWASLDFNTNGWTFDPDQGNWDIDPGYGNPSPSAFFQWWPEVTNYSYALVSKNLAGAGMPNVFLQYDIHFDSYSSASLEQLEVEVWNGISWVSVDNYTNQTGDIPWTTANHNISTLAVGHDFKVRFRAHGQNSFNIDWWNVDNIRVYSQVAASALLNAWIDFNKANGWADQGEQIFVDQPLVAGLNSLIFPVPMTAVSGGTYARFRINQNGGLGYAGLGYEGEVEDYQVVIEEGPTPDYDFGDAPDGPYPTLLVSNGAHHMLDGTTFLGFVVDAEVNGLPLIHANGDDLNNLDDEDGVKLMGSMLLGSTTMLEVYANSSCMLNAWFDFNANGSWADGGEQVFLNTPLNAGINLLNVFVPASASLGDLYARFRVNQNGGISYDGYGFEGEVEDYKFIVFETLPDMKMGNPQFPDPTGWDVNMTFPARLGDDWLCTETGYVEDIHFWVSWWEDVIPAEFEDVIDQFEVSIYSDIPANQSPTGYSIPGDLLWTRDFSAGFYTWQSAFEHQQGWYDPYISHVEPNDHYHCYRIDMVNIPDAFLQQEGTVYWLVITAYIDNIIYPEYYVGWKTSPDHWNDNAVYDSAGEWFELYDPLSQEDLDLAFIITGNPPVPVCDPPTDLYADNITTNTADLYWTPNGVEEYWNIEYGLEGFEMGTGTSVGLVLAIPYALTGLQANTGYDFYVQSVCDQLESEWAGPANFMTESEIIPGDANCDGEVNVLDIITIVNYIMGANPNPFCFDNADVNGDDQIDVLDIIAVVNIIMQG